MYAGKIDILLKQGCNLANYSYFKLSHSVL